METIYRHKNLRVQLTNLGTHLLPYKSFLALTTCLLMTLLIVTSNPHVQAQQPEGYQRTSPSYLATLPTELLALRQPSPGISNAPLAPTVTFNVTWTTDELDAGACGTINSGSGAGADGQLSLREAICEANNTAATNTVNVPAGTYTLSTSLGELKTGTTSGAHITISGAGAASTIIQASQPVTCPDSGSGQTGCVRVFDLDPSLVGGVSVSISGVTVQNGRATIFGGAGIIGGSANNATDDTVTLSNCIVTNNKMLTTATNRPGGGVSVFGGNMSITNCTISNNSSGASPGGGVDYGINSGFTGLLTVSGTTFSGNTDQNNNTTPTATGGGGLHLSGPATYSVSGSTFTNNTVDGTINDAFGGGLKLDGGTLTLTTSTFTGNTATSASHAGAGGGIWLGGSTTATLNFNRIVGNFANTNSGNGAYASGVSGSFDATNNWWGCDSGPNNTGCDRADSAGATITSSPRIVLKTTASPNPINYGQSTTLTASFLQNSSNTSLTLANIATLIGLPVTWTNAQHGTLSNQQSPIQSNGTATATFTAGSTSADCGAVGKGEAEVDNIQLNESPATASITIDCPDLQASKTNNVSGQTQLANGSACPPQCWTWTLTGSNSGPGFGTYTNGQTILTDTLPNSNISYGSVNVTPNAGIFGAINCGISVGDILSCTANGTVVITGTNGSPAGSFTASFPVTPTAITTYNNPRGGGSCAIDPNNNIPETNDANNTCSNSVVVTAPDLTVVKSNNVTGTTTLGNNWTWKLHVANSSASATATFLNGDTIITDTLDNSGNLSYGTPTAGNGTNITNIGNISCNIVSSLLTCTATGTVVVGTSGSFDVTFTATPSVVGTYANPRAAGTCQVDPNNVVPETDNSNNDCNSDSVTVTAPDLIISKSGPASAQAGLTMTYTLNAQNIGSASASNVEVIDNLPDCLTSVNSSPAGSLGAGNLLTITLGTLGAGSSTPITITATPPLSCQPSINNSATITTTSVESDTTNNNSNTVNTTITAPDLVISKSGPTSVDASQTITYTLLVTNTGDAGASNVQTIDDLPDCLTGVSSSPSGSLGSGNLLTVTIGSLGIGASSSVTITATVNLSCQPSLSNSATVTTTNVESNTGNNTSNTVNTTVLDVPITGLSATNDSPTNFGGTTNFTATITGGSNVSYAWNFGDGNLGSGATTNHIYPSPGFFTATVTATNSANSLTATTPVTIVSNVNVAILKTVTPNNVAQGAPLTYTLVYSNAGSETATNVVITDIVPLSVTNVSFTNSGATITRTNGITYEWSVADLVPSAGGTITITGNAPFVSTFPTTITNTAQIAASQDANPNDNTSSAAFSIASCFATRDNGTNVFASSNASAVQNAVDAASNGDQVRVAGYCAGVNSDGGENQSVYISGKTLSVQGGYTLTNWTTSYPITQATTLDAQSNGRVIKIVSADGDVSNLIIVNGNTPNDGGGIYAGAALTLTNVSLINNTATTNGGGVRSVGNATVTGTTFVSNTATSGGGALFDSLSTVTNSSFDNNKSTGTGAGGGAYLNGAATLSNVTFDSNTAGTGGAGGAAFANSANVTGGAFTNNSAPFAGGGAYFNSTANVTGTNFTNNIATSNRGGGAYFNGGATLLSTTFFSNSTPTDRGGGAYFRVAADVSDTNFISNTASNRAGGAYFFDSATVTNTNFMSNTGTARAGGLYAGNNSTVSGGLFQNNQCSSSCFGGGVFVSGTLSLDNAQFISNTADSSGGGVYVANGSAAVNGGLFQSNHATNTSGGGLYVSGPAFITSTQFLSNTANAQGGGAWIGASQITSAQFMHNQAGTDGGGLYANDGTVLSSTLVLSNTAGTTGGGVHFEELGTVTDSTIRDNVAGTKGGGIYDTKNLVVDPTTIAGNHADSDGGGIYAAAALSLSDTQLITNTSGNNGGGAYVTGSLTLTDTQFLTNTAKGGGGAYATGTATTNGGLFQGNQALTTQGGGVFANNTLNSTGTQFIRNTAVTNGGGLYVNSKITLSNTQFLSNTATAGGGVYGTSLFAPSSSIQNSLFQYNGASDDGGAILLTGASNVTVSQNRFLNNNATNGGGALYLGGLGGGAANTTVNNNFFANNTSANGAADIGAGGPSPSTLNGKHNSFAGTNGGSDTSVNAGNDTSGDLLTLSDSIFDGYQIGAHTGPFSATITLNGLLWNNVTTQTSGAGISVSNALTGTPAFVDRANGDLHLTSSSYAIDRGISPTPLTDIDGDPRPQGNGPDIGADETPYFADLAITKVATPSNVGPGQPITFTLTYTQSGTGGIATNVVITDLVPSQVTNVSYTNSGASITPTNGITYSWNVNDLGAGDGGIITITGIISPNITGLPLVITNTATLKSSTPESNANNDSSDASVTINDVPVTGLSAANSSPAAPSDTVFFTATIATGTNVTFDWNYGDGNTGSGQTSTHAYVASGFYTAIVTATNSVSQITATTPVTISMANLGVLKTDSPDPVSAGNNLTYTLVISNAGPTVATNAVFTDVVPTNTTFQSLNAPGWSCSTPSINGTGTISCNKASLGIGETVTFTLVVNVNAATAQDTIITNTAYVSSDTFDPDTSNNSSTATTNVIARANLAINKSDNPDPVYAGANLTYTLVITNAGPSTATNVTLTDTLPSGESLVSITPNTGCSGTTTIVCNVGTLAPNTTATRVIVVHVDPAQRDPLSNTATVGSDIIDPDTNDNSSTATTTVIAQADMSVTKTASPNPPVAGQQLTYNLTVTNNGPSSATNVLVTDTLPLSVTWVATDPNGSCSGTGVVTCSLGTFAPNTSELVTITVNVPASVPNGTVITNTAQTSANEPDANNANNTFVLSSTVMRVADLAIAKSVSVDTRASIIAVTFVITVTNNGPSNATGVVMTDTMPSGISTQTVTPSQGSCSGTAVVVCSLGNLSAGAHATITIVGFAQNQPGHVFTNTAVVYGNEFDPNLANNTVTVQFTLQGTLPKIYRLFLPVILR